MAAERGGRKSSPRKRGTRAAPRSAGGRTPPPPEDSEAGARLGGLPELARRALGLGLSGFFLTEETIRRAVGDTLPRDWMDFAVDQSERSRKEFLDRLAVELASVVETMDFAAIAERLIEGRTIEVEARFRVVPRSEEDEPGGLRLSLVSDGEKRR